MLRRIKVITSSLKVINQEKLILNQFNFKPNISKEIYKYTDKGGKIMKSHDKSFLIALLTWFTFSLALTFAGIYFTTALGIAMLISIAAFVFFEYEFFQIKRLNANGN